MLSLKVIFPINEFSSQFLVLLRKSSQMSKNTSISLGNYFDEFVQSRIDEGRFKNVSEVIRAGLRLLEEEEARILALKAAINDLHENIGALRT